jgi:uncharacterized protein (DUF1697 family)
MKFVVFFRGINVGGHKKAPMADLKAMFSKMGFENVKTLLNSGNVVFETDKIEEGDLIKKIDENFQKSFGFESKIMVRTMEQIQKLVDLKPFEEIDVDKDTRLYVSFLPEETDSSLKLPYTSPNGDFKILQKTNREVFSVLNLKNTRSVDAMAFLEKEYGKDITTRNWNTVMKIIKL